jgi:Raf kinase inhibitor-like YbhB/YbcL family protein
MPGTRIRRSKPPRTRRPVELAITSPAFQDSERIPDVYAMDGGNVSPALYWSRLPEGTAAVAIICEDPDAPGREAFTHWVLFNIPPSLPGVPEGIPKEDKPSEVAGAEQGVNDFGNVGYDGPAPPPGRGVHRYQFQLYALDEMLSLPPEVTKLALQWTMEGHILGKGVLRGLYSR